MLGIRFAAISMRHFATIPVTNVTDKYTPKKRQFTQLAKAHVVAILTPHTTACAVCFLKLFPRRSRNNPNRSSATEAGGAIVGVGLTVPDIRYADVSAPA